MRTNRQLRRGTSTTELALVAPLLVTMVLFGMYFSEIVRAKLKLLEASRFSTWELTSYVLDDYGSAQHTAAFNEARDRTVRDASARFTDLDSVSDRGNGGSLIAAFSGFEVTLENKDVTMRGTFSTVHPSDLPPAPGGLTGDAAQAHRLFGFNPQGMVQADVRIVLENRILPKNFLNDPRGFFSVDQWGGRSLQSLVLRNRFTMITSGWQLADGADAQMQKDESQGGRVAGLHRGNSTHGMWTQVDRMMHLGTRRSESSVPGLFALALVSPAVPHPFNSTYVTAHNYGSPNAIDRGCTSGAGSNDPGHPEPAGMNNLDVYSALDVPNRKCFDTAPFRDRVAYDQSLYIEQYMNRGDYFMGCINAEADDPAHGSRMPLSSSDVNRRKIPCGGRP